MGDLVADPPGAPFDDQASRRGFDLENCGGRPWHIYGADPMLGFRPGDTGKAAALAGLSDEQIGNEIFTFVQTIRKN